MYYVFQNICIVFVLYLQNRAFPKRVVSISDLRVMSLNARGCQCGFRMNVNLKWKSIDNCYKLYLY